MQEQEQELFEGYEIKHWDLSPRFYKIIAASVVFNLFAVLVMAQGGLLTRKGCDSPFVKSVCQVLDTVVLGSSLLGTDSEFVSKDYEKNELENADITYIDVSSNLNYPDGYFALANPEQFAMQQEAMLATGGFGGETFNNGEFPTIPSMTTPSAGNDLLGSKPNLPPINNNPIIGNLPSSINGSTPPVSYPKIPRRKYPRIITPKMPKISNNSPSELPDFGKETAGNKTGKPKATPTPEQKPIESEKVADIEINKKPFEDLGDTLNAKLEKKEIDLNQPFSVVLDGVLTKEGKFDDKKSKYKIVGGDPKMAEMAVQALEAVGYSGILAYLKNNGVDKVNFQLIQDDKQIYAIIASDQKTPERAATTASQINSVLQLAIFADSNGLKKLDDNSKTLVNNSKVTSNGKTFVLNFAIPKQMGQDLIDKSLKERAAKKNSTPPSNSNGLSQNSNANNSK